jgi:hypothetical protein
MQFQGRRIWASLGAVALILLAVLWGLNDSRAARVPGTVTSQLGFVVWTWFFVMREVKLRGDDLTPLAWRLLRLVIAGFLLLAAGWLMAIFPATRVPGTVIAVMTRWILVTVLVVLAVSLTIHTLGQNRDGPLPDLNNLANLAFMLGIGFSWGLVLLANPTDTPAPGGHIKSLLPALEVFVLTWCLFYVLVLAPEIIHRKLPFEHASEQAVRLVPAVLAVSAAMVTGVYLLGLHFFNEPLAKISPGVLAAAIVAVVALLMPLYQLIVRACWRYGLANLLNPKAWWFTRGQVMDEIRNYQARAATQRDEILASLGDAVDALLTQVSVWHSRVWRLRLIKPREEETERLRCDISPVQSEISALCSRLEFIEPAMNPLVEQLWVAVTRLIASLGAPDEEFKTRRDEVRSASLAMDNKRDELAEEGSSHARRTERGQQGERGPEELAGE